MQAIAFYRWRIVNGFELCNANGPSKAFGTAKVILGSRGGRFSQRFDRPNHFMKRAASPSGRYNPRWPAHKVEQRAVAELRASLNNPRLHSDDQIGLIVNSISEWGWTMPILVDEHNEVIAGHGRLAAARRLGIERAPVIVARGWTEAQKRAYRIADNQLTLASEWDPTLLSAELKNLRLESFDLNLMGFPELRLVQFLADEHGAGGAAGDERVAPKLDAMKYAVIVDCDSERDQTAKLKQFEKMGLKCRALIS